MNYELMYLGHWLHMLGNDIHFDNESLLSINVGDKIKQIGFDTPSSSNRCMICNPYFTYVGSKLISWNNNVEKFYFFQLPAGGLTGWNLFKPEVPVYLAVIYIQCGDEKELLIPCENQTIWIMKPNFIHY